MYYGTSGECLEVCGDGKDFGMNECEDGNIDDFDGCSSKCEVEEGWICSRGSYTSKGAC